MRDLAAPGAGPAAPRLEPPEGGLAPTRTSPPEGRFVRLANIRWLPAIKPLPKHCLLAGYLTQGKAPARRDPPLPEPSPAPAATRTGAGRSSCSCPHEVRRVVVGGKKREGRLAYLIQTGYAWGVPQREPKSFSIPFFSVTDEGVLHRGQAPHATCVGKSLSLRTKALHARALVAHSHPSALMRPRVYESVGA